MTSDDYRVSDTQIQSYRKRVKQEIEALMKLVWDLKRDGLSWAEDQVWEAVTVLESVQIEAEEPGEDDIQSFTLTGDWTLDPDGKELINIPNIVVTGVVVLENISSDQAS